MLRMAPAAGIRIFAGVALAIALQAPRSAATVQASRASESRDLLAAFAARVAEVLPPTVHGVRVGGRYYGIGGAAKLVWVDIASGKTAWSDNSLFFPDPKRAMAAFIVMDKNILSLSSGGELCLFEASPTEFNELGRTQVCGINWCMPAYVDGRLFVRDGIKKKGGNLICLDLTD